MGIIAMIIYPLLRGGESTLMPVSLPLSQW